MSDRFAANQSGLDSPFTRSADAAKSDTVDLLIAARSLYVTGAGDVKFTTVDGDTDTWTVPNNFIIPGRIARVWSTGTTATGIKAIS